MDKHDCKKCWYKQQTGYCLTEQIKNATPYIPLKKEVEIDDRK